MIFLGLIPYLILFFLAITSTYLLKFNKSLLYVFTFLLALFTSFTGTVSPDRERYAIAYITKNYNFEPMFAFLSTIVNHLGLNEYFLFFAFSLLTFLFILNSLELSKKIFCEDNNVYMLGYILYIVIPGMYFAQFITVRQSLAIGLTAYATLLFLEGKNKKKLLSYSIFFIAFLTHYSSILYFLSFLFVAKFFKRFFYGRVYFILFTFSFFISFSPFLKSIIVNFLYFLFSKNDFLSKYIYYVFITSDFGIKDALLVLLKNSYYTILLFLQLFFKVDIQNERIKKIYNILFNLFFLGLLLRNSLAFNHSFIRFSNYFVFPGIISFSFWFSKRVYYFDKLKYIYNKKKPNLLLNEIKIRYLIYFFLITSLFFLYLYNIFLFVGEVQSRIFLVHGKHVMNMLFGF